MHLRSSANVKSSGSLTFAFILVTSHPRSQTLQLKNSLPLLLAKRTSNSRGRANLEKANNFPPPGFLFVSLFL